MDPMIKLAVSAAPGEKKYVIFAGAGLSKDAGIPTAWDIMLKTADQLRKVEDPPTNVDDDLGTWFEKSQYAQLSYAQLIESFYPASPEQQAFLEKLLDGHEPGEGHKGVAEMVRRDMVRAIVTTNFDQYIERVLRAQGLPVQVLSNDEDLKNTEPLIHCKKVRIYKPHGDLGKGALKNTPKDLESLSPTMHDELIRVLSDHGVIVIGYSGSDKGICEVFAKRVSHYPLFWVNLTGPPAEFCDVIGGTPPEFIECTGAGQFFEELFALKNKLELMAPTTADRTSFTHLMDDIERRGTIPSTAVKKYFQGFHQALSELKPALDKFEYVDDAIVDQIARASVLVAEFSEVVHWLAGREDDKVLDDVYAYFGQLMILYSVPDDFTGSYRSDSFDGYLFIGHELFVHFIAALISYNKWPQIGALLSQPLYVGNRHATYESYADISNYTSSIDESRKQRLGSRRISLHADLLQERYNQTALSKNLAHVDFMEADYFLFLHSILGIPDEEFRYPDLWRPWSTLFLRTAPSFIKRCESRKFLKQVSGAITLSPELFIDRLQSRHEYFGKFWGRDLFRESPLEYVDFQKFGRFP